MKPSKTYREWCKVNSQIQRLRVRESKLMRKLEREQPEMYNRPVGYTGIRPSDAPNA